MILFSLRPRTLLAGTVVAAGALSATWAAPCDAQDRDQREVRIMRTPGGVSILRGAPADRAVLGVVLAEDSRADTAGVRLETVDANSPAAKAGLKAGDVLTAINGVSLKVASEDAEDLALAGLAQRRLQRVMATAKPGDEVKLQVRSGSNSRTVSVKTASADELERTADKVEERVITRTPGGRVMERTTRSRGVIGVSVGTAGNVRDTLGLFISSVSGDGAAEKAGIVEGERIAAVNGVDVRVPREDVDDAQVASARTERFVREVQKVEPGKTLSLRVWGNGRYRDVSVTVQQASELPRGVMGGERVLMKERMPGVRLDMIPEGEVRIRRNGEEPQVFEFRRDGSRGRLRINGDEIEIDGAGIERAMEEMGRKLQERMREVEIDVRDMRGLPGRAGAVRVRTTRAAII